MKKTMSILAIAGLILALAPAAQAALITVSNVTASSTIYGPVGRIIDGTGLAGALHATATTSEDDNNSWLSSGDTAGAAGAADEWVQFDLGAVYTISSFKVWNFQEGGWDSGRGVDAVAITYGTEISGSLADGTVATITTGLATHGTTAFANETWDNNPYAGTTYTETFDARYILFDIGSNQNGSGSPQASHSWVGLAEVQFDGVPVPEPATMSLLALGGLAMLRRRRRA